MLVDVNVSLDLYVNVSVHFNNQTILQWILRSIPASSYIDTAAGFSEQYLALHHYVTEIWNGYTQWLI